MKRKILMLLLMTIFLFSTGMVLRQQMQYRKIAVDSAEAAQLAGLPERAQLAPPDPTQSGASEASAPPEDAAALSGLDLSVLQAVNRDVVGWIAIPGTQLSYPLVQGEDNKYYLTHSWKRDYCAGGAVFLECTNSPALDGFHTIAYAHRMRDGSMFGMLKHYRDLDFWQQHPSVYLVTDNGISRYEIFAAREAPVEGLVYRLDLEESGLKEEFIQDCVEHSVIDTGIVPTAEDRLLTLSTCTGHGYSSRWVLHCVLECSRSGARLETEGGRDSRILSTPGL